MSRGLREKRWRKAVTACGVICLSMLVFMPGQAPAQVTEEWVARYNGPDNGLDIPRSIAVDSSGNVYVTGYSYGSGTDLDYATVKYDPVGNELWVRRYNGSAIYQDIPNKIVVDSSGNVYVTGRSGNESATIKYDPDGNEVWAVRYYSPPNVSDNLWDLAVDTAGNVYVSGDSWDSLTVNDFVTVKYDSAGNEVWVRRYNGPGNYYDGSTCLGVDSTGNVYVTGYSGGSGTPGSSYDFATVKYDPAGNEVWVRRYDGPANSNDTPTGIAVDSTGNVYVTGVSIGSGMDSDYATVKYDSAGNELWVRRYDGPGNGYDQANSIAIDSTGNVHVTGYSWGAATNYDYATVKYDPAGNELWVRRYNGPGNNSDNATSIAIDSTGNVYVTGFVVLPVAGDFGTIKYDSAGNELWVQRYNGPANNTDSAAGIAVDSTSNVYVTGYSIGSGSGYDFATVKYSQNPDTDGDGVPDSSDNSPDVYNPSQSDIDSDGAGDASDNCPWNTPNPGQENTGGDPLLGDACEDYYSETASLLDATFKSPTDPIEVEACFTYSGPFASILTFPPDCYNTTFELFYSGGPAVADTNRRYRIRKAYGIPPDLVTISQGETRCVTCDMRDLFHPSVFDTPPGTSIDFTGYAAFANYVTDPDFDPVTGLCTDSSTPNCPIDPNDPSLTCCDVWIGAVSSSQFSLTVANPITVLIDIKPGVSPNIINLGSNGNVPVAILGSATFDATMVDPYTITLSGSTVKVKGKAETPMASPEDVNGDGLMDLVVHVLTQGLQLTETAEVAILKGYTTSGVPIQGSDMVEVKQ